MSRELDPALVPSAEAWTTLCLYGGLWGRAADVMDACDRAAELAPGDGAVRRNRGIARALAGDVPGAIADLAYVPPSVGERDRARRDAWSAALRRGENPFTPELLDEMRR